MKSGQKLSSRIAERALLVQGTNKIQLLGAEALKEFGPFKDLDLSEVSEFFRNFDEDSMIFYVIEKHGPDGILDYERGIGHIEKGKDYDDGYYLVRESPLYSGPNAADVRRATSLKNVNFSTLESECLIVCSIYPPTYIEALSLPYSVISGSDNGVIATVLKKNSLLGRLNGDIECVTIKELGEIPEFRALIKEIINEERSESV